MDVSYDEILKRSNGIIIDIRSFYEYQKGHISGAICIPEQELINSSSKYLKKDITYYLYCNHGHRSKNVSNFLNKLGYHTVNILGGYYNSLLR